MSSPRRARRLGYLVLGLAPVLALSACGLDAEESLGDLPPIRTTTTTSTTTTVPDPNRYFYEVKPGDTLFAIGSYFQVPMSEIVALNNLEDADDIQVGQMLEIPSGLVIVTIPDEIRLGGATTTSEPPVAESAEQ